MDEREIWVKVRYTDLERAIRLAHESDRDLHSRLQKSWLDGVRRDWKYRFPKIWTFFH